MDFRGAVSLRGRAKARLQSVEEFGGIKEVGAVDVG